MPPPWRSTGRTGTSPLPGPGAGAAWRPRRWPARPRRPDALAGGARPRRRPAVPVQGRLHPPRPPFRHRLDGAGAARHRAGLEPPAPPRRARRHGGGLPRGAGLRARHDGAPERARGPRRRPGAALRRGSPRRRPAGRGRLGGAARPRGLPRPPRRRQGRGLGRHRRGGAARATAARHGRRPPLGARPRVLAAGLDYRGRPSFQEYSTYTAGLAAANRAFLRGPGAPRWVLFGPESPTATWRSTAASRAGRGPAVAGPARPLPARPPHRRPRGAGAARRAGAGRRSGRPATPRRGFGAVACRSATGGPVWATVDVRPNLAGRVLSALFRPPLLTLAVRSTTAPSGASGWCRPWRRRASSCRRWSTTRPTTRRWRPAAPPAPGGAWRGSPSRPRRPAAGSTRPTSP